MKMVRGLFAAGAATVVLAFGATSVAKASSLFFGQYQAYSAVVRSDGKVVTFAKFYLSNNESSDLTSTSFTIPDGVEVSDVSVYQVMPPKRCSDTQPAKTSSTTTKSSYITDYVVSCDDIKNNIYDFNNSGYYYGGYGGTNDNLVYKKIDPKISGSTYNLTLPSPIASNDRGAYIVAYLTNKGYVTSNFGVYHLKFQTLQVPDSVQVVRVSVDVSSDFYTKAGRTSISAAGKALDSGVAQGVNSAASAENKSLDSLQGTIGSGGVFEKTGKSLASGESFVVTGTFADAAWKLNFWWILGGLVAFVIAVPACLILFKKANALEERRHGGK